MTQALFGSVDQMERAMTFHRERHAVLAGNVANVDTPGYQPVDLVSDAAATSASLAATHPGHLPNGSGSDASLAVGRVVSDPAAAGSDGNAVSLEREMAKVQANRTRYATTSELVSRRLALMRYAASDGAA